MTATTSAPPDAPAALAAPPRLGGRELVAMPEVRWAAVALALFAVGALAQLAGAPPGVFWSLYLACYAAGGWEPALAGLRTLREGALDVDLLMVVAAVGAAAIGQVFDGALLIVIFATSGALEAFTTRRTEDSVRALLELAPERAHLVARGAPDGSVPVAPEDVDVADLGVGDEVLVRPGEQVGADGVVVSGASEVDESSVTGESVPAAKGVGAAVYAGTLNGTGSLRVRVEAASGDSLVARIGAMVERASSTKATRQLFIEKVEQRYSVGVVVATLALFTVPLLLGAPLEDALLRAMTFMIVASPCALVLATMPPLLAAMANAGRHGVLVKSAVAMERLAEVDQVVLDKTGTLTLGAPQLARVQVLTGAPVDEDAALGLAAAAERLSEHPLAAAVVDAARSRGLRDEADVTDFDAAPGRGVSALVGGRRVEVCAPTALAADGPPPEDLAEAVADAEARGWSTAVVLLEGRPVAVLALADEIRPEAAPAVAALALATAHPPALLTGDHHRAAARVAGATGIEDVRTGLLPQDKADHVDALQAQGRRLALVGDGINDAPAMASAHAGLAMGRRGSDLALQTADAVVVRDDLRTVPAVLHLAARARRVVRANLVIAGTVIVVLVTWDLFWHLPLPLGVAGHEGSTVLVALNGLRLLSSRAWRAPAA
ncbi:heavy metal translocating P-type ATPase [uncultured Pseudokineococcus sp.]|uniref:heavy metal translocating P-type ATPase n=1 Tax=uncultured Pseudokineococcus sp. TaxID=1642928 RepID=UPI0026042CB8|nr:heavy metal translocating P-type ATPase [uncultured Pseudokineococcus sp.]